MTTSPFIYIDIKTKEDFFVHVKKQDYIIKNAVSLRGFSTLPFALLDDEDVCDFAISQNTKNFKAISDRLKTDNKFIRRIIFKHRNPVFNSYKNIEVLKWCNKDVVDSKDFMLSLIKDGVNCYNYGSNRLLKDADFFVESIKNVGKNFTSLQVGKLFRSASEDIQNDNAILLRIYKEALLQYLTLSNGIIPLEKQLEIESLVKGENLTEDFYASHVPSLIENIQYRLGKGWVINGELRSLNYLCNRMNDKIIESFIKDENHEVINFTIKEFLFKKQMKRLSHAQIVPNEIKSSVLNAPNQKKRRNLKAIKP